MVEPLVIFYPFEVIVTLFVAEKALQSSMKLVEV